MMVDANSEARWTPVLRCSTWTMEEPYSRRYRRAVLTCWLLFSIRMRVNQIIHPGLRFTTRTPLESRHATKRKRRKSRSKERRRKKKRSRMASIKKKSH